MSDSNAPERPDATQERDYYQRVEGIKRWVEYITSEPPDRWGPQQNSIVNDQLDAAQRVQTSPSHHQHVRNVAAAIIEERETSRADRE